MRDRGRDRERERERKFCATVGRVRKMNIESVNVNG